MRDDRVQSNPDKRENTFTPGRLRSMSSSGLIRPATTGGVSVLRRGNVAGSNDGELQPLLEKLPVKVPRNSYINTSTSRSPDKLPPVQKSSTWTYKQGKPSVAGGRSRALKSAPSKVRHPESVTDLGCLFDDGNIPADSLEMAAAPSRPGTAWQQFEAHVKHVNDMSMLLTFSQKPARFRASDQFKKIMDVVGPKKKDSGDAGNDSRRMSIRDTEDEDEQDRRDFRKQAEVRRKSQFLQRASLRGWLIIRRYVHEQKMQKKEKQTFGWNFLRHTISNMTDMEKAREKLYEKYIHHPNQWIEGLINVPDYLARRLKADQIRKEREEAEAEEKEREKLERLEKEKHLHGRAATNNKKGTSNRAAKKRRKDNRPQFRWTRVETPITIF